MGLLRNMPSELLQQEPPDHQRKGTELNVLLLYVCVKALYVMPIEAVYKNVTLWCIHLISVALGSKKYYIL
jgi:hypothetical protein